MDIQTTKLDLIRRLTETTDVGILQQMVLLFSSDKKSNDSWGYDADGKKITTEMMLQFIQKADEDEKAGRLISQEDLEKESENW